MWCFRRKAAGEKIRNPIQGEFFATDAIEGPAQALVRESVQNSLDARNGDGPVQVHITLAAGDDALPSSAVAGLFSEAWPHYAARGNGLQAPPAPGSPCPFLLVEDFGTKGLSGDPTQGDPDPDPDRKNPFFLFFRAEGLSAKTGTELGRWGIGKFVFPRSSLASTHFGVTVRHDDQRRMLLGAVTLKAHRVEGEDAMYSPDGLFGLPSDDEFVSPIEDAVAIDDFCRLFRVTRTSEPGLSVVVPFVDPDITFEALLHASVKDYFLPIMDARLEITVTAGASTVRLAADTLDQVVAEHRAVLGDALHAFVGLARAAIGTKEVDRIVLGTPDPNRAAKWSDDLISATALEALRARFAAREVAAIRVPVTVRPKSGGALPSWFDVFLLPDKNSDGRPVFVREGIIVSDVRGRRAREVRALVVVENKTLATMLGDSENPAHTQWQKDGSNFKGRYIYGTAVIGFVTESVGELLAIVNRRTKEADPSLTVDFFSVEPPEESEETEEADAQRRKQKRGPEGPNGEIVIPPRPTRIRIVRSNGGFMILPGSAPPSTPYLIQVRCAYDVRAGNPLKKWDAADFAFGAGGLPITCEGSTSVVIAKNNSVVFRVDGPEFRAGVIGFDVNRDVFVRAETSEVTDAGPQA